MAGRAYLLETLSFLLGSPNQSSGLASRSGAAVLFPVLVSPDGTSKLVVFDLALGRVGLEIVAVVFLLELPLPQFFFLKSHLAPGFEIAESLLERLIFSHLPHASGDDGFSVLLLFFFEHFSDGFVFPLDSVNFANDVQSV